MFHSASVRLTTLYLGILMAMSLFFSINIYRISTQELTAGLRRQASILERAPRFRDLLGPRYVDDLRQDQLVEGRQKIFDRLVFINLIILVVGGAGCYWLARRSLEPIESAHAAQGRFTSDAAHELRTPLAAMRAEIEVALREPKLTKEQAKELLQSNLEELAKLTALSESLLLLARQEHAGVELGAVSLKQIAAQTLDDVRSLAKLKKIKLENQAAQDLEVIADEITLKQLLVILLDNAIKYSPEGSTVTLAAQKSGRQIQLAVSDQGPGIPKHEQVHIFDRFYRGDNSRTKAGSNGFGLGLSIAQRLAAHLRTSIKVSDAESGGSVFSLNLTQFSKR